MRWLIQKNNSNADGVNADYGGADGELEEERKGQQVSLSLSGK